MASLEEIDCYYDILDVLDANDVLDTQEEADRRATERD